MARYSDKSISPVLFASRRVILLRSDIRHMPSGIRFASFRANRISLKPQGFNITIAIAIISLFAKAKNITKSRKRESSTGCCFRIALSLCFYRKFRIYITNAQVFAIPLFDLTMPYCVRSFLFFYCSLSTGSSNQKVEPSPSLLSTPYSAPCFSSTVLTIESPSPVPTTARRCTRSTL